YCHYHLMFYMYSDSPYIYTLSLHDALPICLVALVVSAAVLISCGGMSRSMPTPSPPSNMTIASYRGVGVFVPSTWPHDRLQCGRSEEHTSELQSPCNIVCRLLLEKKKNNII